MHTSKLLFSLLILLFVCGATVQAQLEYAAMGLTNVSSKLNNATQRTTPALTNLALTKQDQKSWKIAPPPPILGNIQDRVSLMLNIRAFTQAEPIDDVNDVLYSLQDVTAFSLNLRLFNVRQWAFRIGAGYQDVDYKIDPDFSSAYNALRRDYLLFLGIEKHFQLPIVDIYPGVIVPIVYVGEEEIEQNLIKDNIENGQVDASIGVLLGANFRLLNFLRLGGEFHVTYQDFKQQVWRNLDEPNKIQLRALNYNFEFVVGIAF